MPNRKPAAALQQDYRTAQLEFYQRDNDGIADDAKPYATAVFENSPLGRMLEQGGVGADWQPEAGHHTQRLSYSFNDGSTGDVPGAVRLFNVDGTSTQFYPAGQLHRVVTTDEDGKNTIQFVNPQGNVIVRKVKADDATGYLETYYLYDAFDRVSFIIPPQGVAALKTNGWSLTAAIRNSYAYQFTYDERGRIVKRKCLVRIGSTMYTTSLTGLSWCRMGRPARRNDGAFLNMMY